MDQIAQELKACEGKSVLLLTHHNADPDAVCSAFALSEGLKQLGASTTIGVVESASKIAQHVLEKLRQDFVVDPNLDCDLLVLLDTATPGQLSKFAENVIKFNARKIIIDHHAEQGKSLTADLKYVDDSARSTAELIHELLGKLGVETTREMALALIIGMVTDTAHFRFATVNNFRIITRLMETHNIAPGEVMGILTLRPDISERIALMKAARRIRFYRVSDYLIATSSIRSFEASAARSFLRLGADVSVVVAKREDEIRISLRSNSTFFEETGINLGKDVVPELAKIVNGSGSGHPTAAGVNGEDTESAGKALDYVIDYIRKRVGQ